MDENELASSFAAKNENIELKNKVKALTDLKNMHEKQIADLYKKNREMAVFISDLGRFPKFWASSYKHMILNFIKKHGLWDGDD